MRATTLVKLEARRLYLDVGAKRLVTSRRPVDHSFAPPPNYLSPAAIDEAIALAVGAFEDLGGPASACPKFAGWPPLDQCPPWVLTHATIRVQMAPQAELTLHRTVFPGDGLSEQLRVSLETSDCGVALRATTPTIAHFEFKGPLGHHRRVAARLAACRWMRQKNVR